MKNNNADNSVYSIVTSIPRGKVSTYKQAAKLSGVKNPRQIGRILHQNKNPDNIPCHRVIRSDGYLADNYAFGGISAQRKKLKKEGIGFSGKKVKTEFIWLATTAPLK